MGIPGAAIPLLIPGAVEPEATAESVARSIRLNNDDDVYFSRTITSGGNRKKWSFSAWVKRAGNTYDYLFAQGPSGSTSGNWFLAGFQPTGSGIGDDVLWIGQQTGGGYNLQYATNRRFRDPHAWFHILIAVDTTQSTASNRLRLYINGTEETSFSTETDPSQDLDTWVGATSTCPVMYVGRQPDGHALDGYIANVHFIDGTQITPSDVTKTDSTTGQLIPAEFDGTYGTNGTHLKFEDITGNTAATLGKDSSGQNNHFTPHNTVLSLGAIDAAARITVNSGTNGWVSGHDQTKAFDSSENTYASGTSGNAPGAGFTWNAAGLGLSGALEIKTYGDGGNPSTLTCVHSGGTTTVVHNSGTGYANLGTVGTITSIKVSRLDQGIIHAIKLNSSLLVQGAGHPGRVSSVRDSPTDGGTQTTAGGAAYSNYCTFNGLIQGPTFKYSNLYVEGDGDTGYYNRVAAGTILLPSTGKFMFEYYCLNSGGTGSPGRRDSIGIYDTSNPNDTYLSNIPNSVSYFSFNGNIVKNLNNEQTGYPVWAIGNTAHCAIDCATGKVWFGVDGTWQGNPAGGTGEATTLTNNGNLVFAQGNVHNFTNAGYDSKGYINFGQIPWKYTAPSGFKALTTAELDAPAIATPSGHMDTHLYTGDDNTGRTISPFSFQPDLVWFKCRNHTFSHELYDAVRGATKAVYPDLTNTEGTESNGLTAFTANGFTVGNGDGVNDNNKTYAAWAWNMGGSNSSPSGGTISSTVRANTTAGMSIATWIASGTSNDTVAHGLGAVPDIYFLKSRDGNNNWLVYTQKIDGSLDYLVLNATHAKGDSTANAPTSSVISVAGAWTNTQDEDMVGYFFRNISGFSKTGIYEGNNNANGAFVYCGFRPSYVWTKSVDSSDARNWQVLDNARDPDNPASANLFFNLNNAESSYVSVDMLSNGFKLRSTGANSNVAETYLYLAFAEEPFKYARAH